ncbi:MAG: hypothetical protein QM489_00575 [Candidatus Izemoplasma sp.]
MKDFNGNLVNMGNSVVTLLYNHNRTPEFVKGVVVGITEKSIKVKLASKNPYYPYHGEVWKKAALVLKDISTFLPKTSLKENPYQCRPCPECGEFANGTERCMDGNMSCKNGHEWKR